MCQSRRTYSVPLTIWTIEKLYGIRKIILLYRLMSFVLEISGILDISETYQCHMLTFSKGAWMFRMYGSEGLVCSIFSRSVYTYVQGVFQVRKDNTWSSYPVQCPDGIHHNPQVFKTRKNIGQCLGLRLGDSTVWHGYFGKYLLYKLKS